MTNIYSFLILNILRIFKDLSTKFKGLLAKIQRLFKEKAFLLIVKEILMIYCKYFKGLHEPLYRLV